MDAEAPTPEAQPTNPQRERWSRSFAAMLRDSGMTAAEFVRRADHPRITKEIVSQWQRGKSGVSPEAAIRAAQVFKLPATQVLREASLDEIAAYIDDVAGTATDAAALEPLIARVRTITEGLTPEERSALERELLAQIGDWYMLAEAKAARLRRATEGDGVERGAS